MDDYDHHSLSYPEGNDDVYRIEYKECIATIYQSFGGKELYPTLEDKASALLYFIVKNHSFADGNKRIGATVFLYFLEKNEALYKDNDLRISEETLAILTILIAVSEPKDKEMIIKLVKTVLN